MKFNSYRENIFDIQVQFLNFQEPSVPTPSCSRLFPSTCDPEDLSPVLNLGRSSEWPPKSKYQG